MAGSPLRKGYLVLYNAASAVAWAMILVRVATVYFNNGPGAVPLVVDDFARVTQTFAVMEIFHALTGMLSSPLATSLPTYQIPPPSNHLPLSRSPLLKTERH